MRNPFTAVQVLFVLILLSFQNVYAEDSPSDWRFSGFGTIGVTNGGNESIGFRRDTSRYGNFGGLTYNVDTLVGVQADYKVSDSISTAAQFVIRDRPENDLEHSLEWFYLRYNINSELDVRLGRLGTDLFMLSEYRNVGFAYNWVRPPSEFYGSLALDSYDGADFTYTQNLSDGLIRYKLFGGVSKQTYPSGDGDLAIEFNDIYGGSIAWENEHWVTRLVAETVSFASPIQSLEPFRIGLESIPPFLWPEISGLSEKFVSDNKEMFFYAAGLSYDKTPWIIHSEVGYIDSGVGVVFPSLLSAYVSVGHRFDSFTVYSIAAYANSDEGIAVPTEPSFGTIPSLVAIENGLRKISEEVPIDQKSISVGVRWDVENNIAIKFQWNHNWISAYGSGLWDPASSVTSDIIVDTYSINLDFIF